MRLVVVGHTEYVRFGRVQRLPEAGEVLHAADAFSEPSGAGAGTAAVLARLAGSAIFFTALGDDDVADAATGRLAELGVRVSAVRRESMTRQAVALSDAAGERTIVTLGDRHEPRGDDPLPWHELEGADGVYFAAGDERAYALARRCRLLVSTPRARAAITNCQDPPDVVVFSEADRFETNAMRSAQNHPQVIVQTNGARGGSWQTASGGRGAYAAAAPRGPIRDTYGCGDTFAAALTYALARALALEAALDEAAVQAAACLTWRGPYPPSASHLAVAIGQGSVPTS